MNKLERRMPHLKTPYSSILNPLNTTHERRNELAELADYREIPESQTDVSNMTATEVRERYCALYKERRYTAMYYVNCII